VSLGEFFGELFHEDHEADNLYALILQPEPPTFEILMMLKDPVYSIQVIYLEGTPLLDKDLKRCKAEDASAFFIMTNKFSSIPDEEDAKTILQQFSIRRYMVQCDPTLDPLICMQLIRPENKRHLVGGGKKGDGSSTDLVVCLNEIKMGVIAKAVMFPGTNTLIMNLLTSFADDDDEGDGDGETKDDDEMNNWLGEYQKGCGWEIYTTELADMFEGMKFAELSESLYQKLGVVLFGLQIEDLTKDKAHIKMLLNPADFVIPSKETFKIDAFVMATDKAHSDLMFDENNDTGSANMAHAHSMMMMAGLSKAMGSGLVEMRDSRGSVFQPGKGSDDEDEKDEIERKLRNKLQAVEIGKKRQAWQELLHRHDQDKKISTESYQEEMHKVEYATMLRNYYIRSSSTSIEECMINSSLHEELPGITNHIIIIGKEMSSLYDLILPLRARASGPLKYIVVLYPTDFPHSVWARVNIFEGLFIVRGSALEEADLRRAGVFRAKQVVVLGDAKKDSSEVVKGGKAAGLEALIDADAIFCYQCVKRMNESSETVIEIVRHQNVSYLDPESGLNSGDIDYKFTPQFAAGALFISSLLDTMVCQAFYNPQIIRVLSKLVSNAINDVQAETSSQNSTAKSKDSGDSQSVKKKKVLGSSLYQISIPDGLESRTYGSLYKFLAAKNIIPLGLYRGVFSHMKMGPKMNKDSYVFTNPPKDTELFSCDKVYVLSQAPINSGRLGGGRRNQMAGMDSELIEKEIQYLRELRSHRNLVETTAGAVSQIKQDVAYLDEVHNDMETQVDNLAFRIDEKFNLMLSALKEFNGNKEFQCVKAAPPLPPLKRWEERLKKEKKSEMDGLNLSAWERKILLG